jgi:hypothetical protein
MLSRDLILPTVSERILEQCGCEGRGKKGVARSGEVVQGWAMDNAPPQDPRDLRIAQLEAALAATQAALDKALVRIAELERRLNLSSKNSSKPPSSDSPANRAARRTKKSTGKTQGGQKGHEGHHRSLLDESKVDHFI